MKNDVIETTYDTVQMVVSMPCSDPLRSAIRANEMKMPYFIFTD